LKTSLRIKKNIFTILLLSAASLLFANGATAQALDCGSVEEFGNNFSNIILNQVNNRVAGTSKRINRRKTLRINRVESLSFSGCTVYTKANVTLKRKIRRDAHGHVRMKATVSSFNGNRVCLRSPRVTSVSLSRTLKIGEAVYRWVANKILPQSICFNI
jgi:hypothetical protein